MLLDLKIGSRVRLKRVAFANLVIGQTCTVSRISNDGRSFNVEEISEHYTNKFPCYNNSDYWELVETHIPLYSEEQAIAFLKEKGYNIQAPPEPLKGKIVIIKSATGLIFGYPPEQKLASSATVLAIVDWTEGQGLEKPTESSEAVKASSEASEPDGSF